VPLYGRVSVPAPASFAYQLTGAGHALISPFSFAALQFTNFRRNNQAPDSDIHFPLDSLEVGLYTWTSRTSREGVWAKRSYGKKKQD
jgi:hypothetical protein